MFHVSCLSWAAEKEVVVRQTSRNAAESRSDGANTSAAANSQTPAMASGHISVPEALRSGAVMAPEWSNPALPYILWSRQSYETKKSQELSSLLERVLGAGKAGVHVEFEWPQMNAGEAPSLEPALINTLVIVDAGQGDIDTEFIENFAKRVLNMNPERGDKIEVYAVAKRAGWRELLFSPQAILDLIKFSIILLVALLILAIVSRSAGQLSLSLERIATTTRTHDVDLTLTPRMESPVFRPSAQPPLQGATRGRLTVSASSQDVLSVSPSLPFSQADPELLARVLEEENSRTAAVFINALDPDDPSPIIGAGPPRNGPAPSPDPPQAEKTLARKEITAFFPWYLTRLEAILNCI
ncbi:MAG: hypothetical protein HY747_08590 [Elusimicrobia bacterium]|nr:hypothetical protein [Elusimicrobiota bacterium]